MKIAALIRICNIIVTSCLLCCSIAYSQYLHPGFNSVTSTGHGEVNSIFDSQTGGLYNPALINPNLSRMNLSINSGQFSDYLLYFPTLKDLSISYPIIPHRLSTLIHFGRLYDSDLRYLKSGNWLNNPSQYYYGGKYSLGLSAGYRLPLSVWFNKMNLFNIAFGLDLSRFWGNLISNNTYQSSSFWLNNVPTTSGVSVTAGSLIDFSLTPLIKFSFSTVLKGSVADYNVDQWFDYYSIAVGCRYIMPKFTNRSIQLGIETENGHILAKRKLGAGLRYNFTTHRENSLQFGIYTYPKNIKNFRYQSQVYWYTIGLTKTIGKTILSAALSDAINLNLSSPDENSSDVAKVLSVGLSLPISSLVGKKGKKSGMTPEFIDYSIHEREVILGEEDTLSFFIHYLGSDPLPSNNIYFNVNPRTGLMLPTSYVNVPELTHDEYFEIRIPYQAISSQPVNKYSIVATYTFENNKSLKKEFTISTVKPDIYITTTLGSENKYFLFPIPGSYYLSLDVYNGGSVTTDTLDIVLSNNILELGFVESLNHQVHDIAPGNFKNVKIPINTSRTDLPPRIPITISFIENNGFNPLPIHADIAIIDRTRLILSNNHTDHFTSMFSEADCYYLVLDPEYSELQSIIKNTSVKLEKNENFPGRVVTGPYSNINNITSIIPTVEKYTVKFSLWYKQGDKYKPIGRYFFIINNDENTRDVLNQMSIIAYYPDRTRPGKVLVGPFTNLVEIANLQGFMDEFFPNNQVVLRYPNQVDLGLE